MLGQVDTHAVEKLTDMGEAFQLLLQPAVAAMGDEPVYLLVDALDEADPPEQQELGYKGGIKAAGNKALMLIITHLAQLPPNVRFVFTSRPDAVCGDIQQVRGIHAAVVAARG